MSRRWQHEVSAEWLKARQSVLTATEVAGLLPEYKRYLKAGSPDVPTPGFSALWCQKHSDVYLDTSSPSSAAARGHIMEPYAIDEWNRQASPTFYHWDDCILKNGWLGFSPDGMTIPQPTTDVAADILNGNLLTYSTGLSVECPDEIIEVKSYDPAQHMKAIVEDRMEHKELMQLAMSFVVLPKLKVARILWFCPGAPISMYTEEYTRDDLQDQIRWIVEIAETYMKTDAYWIKQLATQPVKLEAKITEDEIYAEHMLEFADDNVFVLK